MQCCLPIGHGAFSQCQKKPLSLFHSVLTKTKYIPSRENSKACFQRLSRSQTLNASSSSNNGVGATETAVPTPIIKIDNVRDPFATIVSIEYGNRLEDLVDTMAAIKNLGLNIRRAKINLKEATPCHKFYVTETKSSEKVLNSSRLEQIRLTILENMAFYHPESQPKLNSGHRVKLRESRDPTNPLGPAKGIAIRTTIEIKESESGSCSEMFITTKDRAGLLVDVVSILKDLNLDVMSAEVDTVGEEAREELFITYHGEPLNKSMQELVQNCLLYYLSLAEVEKEESY